VFTRIQCSTSIWSLTCGDSHRYVVLVLIVRRLRHIMSSCICFRCLRISFVVHSAPSKSDIQLSVKVRIKVSFQPNTQHGTTRFALRSKCSSPFACATSRSGTMLTLQLHLGIITWFIIAILRSFHAVPIMMPHLQRSRFPASHRSTFGLAQYHATGASGALVGQVRTGSQCYDRSNTCCVARPTCGHSCVLLAFLYGMPLEYTHSNNNNTLVELHGT
jgi:hypothetical protein